MAIKSKQSAGAHELSVAMTFLGHEGSTKYMSLESICYCPDGKQMIIGSSDKTIRLWDLRTGKEIEERRIVSEQEVRVVAVSRDGRWVVTGGADPNYQRPGLLKAYEVKKGIVKTFKDHSDGITCIDISPDGKLMASGTDDHTTWIWSLETGKLMAGPLEGVHMVGALRFSRDSRRLAVNAWTGKCLQVWDVETKKLDITTGTPGPSIFMLRVSVFWTTNDKTIVAPFNFSDPYNIIQTIYEFDASTLETVGAPFQGHTNYITGLALSSDCALLVSASEDDTIKLWAFESRQLLASFNVTRPVFTLILSPGAHKVAYSTLGPNSRKICICNIPPDIFANIRPSQDALSTNTPHTTPTDPLNSDVLTTRSTAIQRNQTRVFVAPQAQPLRRSLDTHQQQSSIFRHLHKLLPFSIRRDALGRVAKPLDPLDCPATSPRLPSDSFPAPSTTLVHSNPGENSTSMPALPISETSASSITSHLRNLSKWWPAHRHAVPPIVDVALAPGRLRYATAGAPKPNGGYVRDEDFDSRPPSPNTDSHQAPAGEHGSGRRLCFCL